MISCIVREVSELSETDSEITTHDEDDVYATAVEDHDDALSSPDVDLATANLASAGSKVKGRDLEVVDGDPEPTVPGGPWFERAPRDVSVGRGRTLNCDCVVSGEQPIGQSESTPCSVPIRESNRFE